MLQRLLGNAFWRALYPFLLYQLLIECIYMVIPGAGILIATGIAAVLCTMIFFQYYKKDCKSRDDRADITDRAEIKNPYRLTMIAVLSGVCYCIAGSCLSYIVMNLLGGGSDGSHQVQTAAVMGTGLAAMVLCTGIFIPAAEEFVFRAMMFLRLGDVYKPFLAAVFSAVLFGLYHGNLNQGIYAGIMGYMLGGLLEKHRMMTGPLAFHMAANLTAIVMNYTNLAALMVKNEMAVWLIAGVSLTGLIVFVRLLYRCK